MKFEKRIRDSSSDTKKLEYIHSAWFGNMERMEEAQAKLTKRIYKEKMDWVEWKGGFWELVWQSGFNFEV